MAAGRVLIVFRKAATATKPAVGTLNDPALGQFKEDTTDYPSLGSLQHRQQLPAALEPARLAAEVAAAEQFETDHNAAIKPWRLGVECAVVDPDNRLVARGLECEWEERLTEFESAKALHAVKAIGRA
jgi:hypothetical protein